jgi:hypothetical protein
MAGYLTPRIFLFRTNPYGSRLGLRKENCKLSYNKNPPKHGRVFCFFEKLWVLDNV